MRLMREVFSSSLGKLDDIGRANILQALGRESQMISQSIPGLISTCQAVSSLVFMSLYMATISLFACLIIVVASTIIFYFSARFII
jgi:ABC-type siderophore export system fused ATPase/permease subunit